MVLPQSLLRTAINHPMLVELKNGETYNGHLVSCDGWMNVCLREVICTSKDGSRFWRMPECYIRGNTIKYLKVPDEVIQQVKEDQDRAIYQSSRPLQHQRPGPGYGGSMRGGGRGGDTGGARGRGKPPMRGRGGSAGGGGGIGFRSGHGGGGFGDRN